jgi:hypothetical protein
VLGVLAERMLVDTGVERVYTTEVVFVDNNGRCKCGPFVDMVAGRAIA